MGALICCPRSSVEPRGGTNSALLSQFMLYFALVSHINHLRMLVIQYIDSYIDRIRIYRSLSYLYEYFLVFTRYLNGRNAVVIASRFDGFRCGFSSLVDSFGDDLEFACRRNLTIRTIFDIDINLYRKRTTYRSTSRKETNQLLPCLPS